MPNVSSGVASLMTNGVAPRVAPPFVVVVSALELPPPADEFSRGCVSLTSCGVGRLRGDVISGPSRRSNESFCGPGEAISWTVTRRVVMVGAAAFDAAPPLSAASVPKVPLLPNEVSRR